MNKIAKAFILDRIKPQETRFQCVIFTHDKDIITELFDLIQHRNSCDVVMKLNNILRLKNGMDFIWVKPNDSSRGYKPSHVIIDVNVSPQELDLYISSCCAYVKEVVCIDTPRRMRDKDWQEIINILLPKRGQRAVMDFVEESAIEFK